MAASPAAGWRNWSGAQSCTPSRQARPRDEAELAAVVREASEVRVVGAGHSFSPLVPTGGTLISLDAFSGLLDHDPVACRAEVAAGSRIHQLGPLLHQIGQALPNQGDIDRQSIAGAISTGTHGTGITLGALPTQVRSLRLLTADGEALDCSPERDGEVFAAARLSLGALGVITRLELQNRPSYRLAEWVGVRPLEQVLAEIDGLKDRHRHVETWVFPYGRTAILKTLDETTEAQDRGGASEFTDNVMLRLVCELVRRLPASKAWWQRVVGFFVGEKERVGDSWRIFPSPREVRFHEMEYHLPAAGGPDCLAELVAAVRAADLPVFFPIEYRYVAGDEVWLSPFHGGPRASIAVHQYFKQDPRPLFRLAEPILLRHGGRPHWGKMFDPELVKLPELYPEWERFQAVRRRLDPRGKFLNPFLRYIFGES